MAAVHHAVSGKTSHTGVHQAAHGQGGAPQVTGDRSDDRQRTVLVAYVILDDETRVHAGHFVTGSRGKVQPVDFSPLRVTGWRLAHGCPSPAGQVSRTVVNRAPANRRSSSSVSR